MKELHLLEWNLNFGSRRDAVVAPFVKEYLAGFDVILFTEVVDNESLRDLIASQGEYGAVFASLDHRSNQVVIAVKRGLPARLVYDALPEVPLEEAPDFLQVEIGTGEEALQIMGSRIRISGTSDRDYLCRKKQFEHLARHLRRHSRTILLGDFNNGMIKADSALPYAEARRFYQKTSRGAPSLLRYYNFHWMKDLLQPDFVLDEVPGMSSWGLGLYGGELTFGGIKNDQLIHSRDLAVAVELYDWSFAEANRDLYEAMLWEKEGKRGNPIAHGTPDHAMLKARVLLTD